MLVRVHSSTVGDHKKQHDDDPDGYQVLCNHGQRRGEKNHQLNVVEVMTVGCSGVLVVLLADLQRLSLEERSKKVVARCHN